jgi:hypothetical protein
MNKRVYVTIHWRDKSVDKFESSDVKMGDQFLQPNMCIKCSNREYYVIPSCRIQHIQANWGQYAAQHRLTSLDLVVNCDKKDVYAEPTESMEQPE